MVTVIADAKYPGMFWVRLDDGTTSDMLNHDRAQEVQGLIAFAKTVIAEAFCAAMILRCQAWHQVPAGTLPDDDAALAAMVGLDLENWATIKEQALDGFTRFPDGQDGKSSVRLCHQHSSVSAVP